MDESTDGPKVFVYLAEATDDCGHFRDELARDLRGMGVEILPHGSLADAPDPTAVIHHDLARAAFSIHLFSANRGDRYLSDGRSISQLQYDLAAETLQADTLRPRIVWVPEDVDTEKFDRQMTTSAKKEPATAAIRTGVYRKFLRALLGEPPEIFISYSREDRKWHRVLRAQLDVRTNEQLLPREELVTIWDDQQIRGGKAFKPQIDSHLTSADVFVLLVSSDSLKPNGYCMQEFQYVQERGTAAIIPVLARPVALEGTLIDEFQIPNRNEPIQSAGKQRGAVACSLAEHVKRVASDVRRERREPILQRNAEEMREDVRAYVRGKPWLDKVNKKLAVQGETIGKLKGETDALKQETSALKRWRTYLAAVTAGLAVALVLGMVFAGFRYFRWQSEKQLEAGIELMKDGDVSGSLVYFNAVGNRSTPHDIRRSMALTQQARLSRALYHEGLTFVDFSPDGEYVLTAAALETGRDRGEVKFWETTVANDETPFSVLKIRDPVNSAEWSNPSAKSGNGSDEMFLAVASGDASPLEEQTAAQPEKLQKGEIAVWKWNADGDDWIEHPIKLIGYAGLPTYAAFGRNENASKLVITSHVVNSTSSGGSTDGRAVDSKTSRRSTEVLVWDLAEHREGTRAKDLPRLKLEKGSIVDYASFSGSGRYIVTRRRAYEKDKSVARVWCLTDGNNGKQEDIWLPKTRPLPHSANITSATVSPDDLIVVTTSEDRTARVWDVATGKRLSAPGSGRPIELRHGDFVTHAAISPDSRYVVTASRDNSAVVWEARTGVPVASLIHGSWVNRVKFSPDGRRVMTASRDRTVQVWDIARQQRVVPPLHHGEGVSYAKFSPDGRRVLTRSKDLARIWDLETTNESPFVVTTGESTYVANSEDGRYLLTSGPGPLGRTYETRVWDLAAKEQLPCKFHADEPIRYAQFSPETESASEKRCLLVWSRKETAQAKQGWARVRDLSAPYELLGEWPSDSIDLAALTPGDFDDKSRVLIAHKNGGTPQKPKWKIHVYHPGTGAPVTQDPVELQAWIHHVAASSDGKHFAIAVETLPDSKKGGALLYELDSGQLTEVDRLAHTQDNQPVTFVAFSSDGARLVTTGGDDTARVWDTETGNQMHVMEHDADVVHAAFGPKREQLVTSSFDQTARVWRLSSGKELAAHRHNSKVNRATFGGKDGELLLTASYDGTARLWESTGKPVSILRAGHDVRFAWFKGGEDAIKDGIVTVSYSRLPPVTLAGAPASAVVSPDSELPRLVRTQDWLTWHDNEQMSPQGNLLAAREVSGTTLAPIKAEDWKVLWKNCRRVKNWSTIPPTRVVAEPQPIGLHSDEARVAEANGQWFAARWQLTQALNLINDLKHPELHPERPVLCQRRARLHSIQGEWKEAIADYRAALRLKHEREEALPTRPKADDWRLRQALADALAQPAQLEPQFNQALEIYDQLVADIPGEKQARSAEERSLFKNRARIYGGRARIHESLAGVHHRGENWTAALDDYAKATEHEDNPLHKSRLYVRRAEILRDQLENPDNATMVYDEGIQAAKTWPSKEGTWQLHEGLAELFRRRREWQAAIREYDTAVLLASETNTPVKSSLLDKRGQVYVYLALKEPESLEERFRKLTPKGLWDQALKDLADAVEGRTDDAELWSRWAVAHLVRDRLSGLDTNEYPRICSKMLQRFHETKSSSVANTVAWTCSLSHLPDGATLEGTDQSQRKLAVQLASLAVRLEPEVTPYRYLNTLGAALYRDNDFEGACKALRESIAAYEREEERQATQRQVSGTVWDWLLLAMVCQRLKETRAENDAQTNTQDDCDMEPTVWRDRFEENRPQPSGANFQLRWYQEWQLKILENEVNDLLPRETG